MQKKVLVAFFIILSCVMMGVFAGLLGFANESPAIEVQYETPKKQTTPDEVAVNTWTDKMAKAASRDYHFPVNELFIQMVLREPDPPKTRSFQLVIDRSDRYSQFCIVQTLSAFSLPYVMVKDKNEQSIIVKSPTEDPLKDVVKRLKFYDIESTIKEVWL